MINAGIGVRGMLCMQALALGCSAPGGGSENVAVHHEAETLVNGHRFVLLEPAGRGSGGQSAVATVQDRYGPRYEGDDPALKLAHAMRPVMLRDGREYLGELNIALAERIIEGQKNDTRRRTESGPLEDRLCCGTDNRTYKSNNTSYPYSAFAFSELGCTGTMISASTLVTAAHCIFDTDLNIPQLVARENGDQFMERHPRWALAMDKRDADAAAYEHTDVEAYDVGGGGSSTGPQWINYINGSYIQCYDAFYPVAWVDAVPNPSGPTTWDYAFVDFKTRCGGLPGNTSSWLGTMDAYETFVESNATTLYGFPGKANNGTHIDSIFTSRTEKLWNNSVYQPAAYYKAEIWGMTQPAGYTFLHGDTDKVLKYTIDTSGGQSGSAVTVAPWGTSHYVIGIHSKNRSGFEYNEGRKWDYGLYTFADTYTWFPN